MRCWVESIDLRKPVNSLLEAVVNLSFYLSDLRRKPGCNEGYKGLVLCKMKHKIGGSDVVWLVKETDVWNHVFHERSEKQLLGYPRWIYYVTGVMS